MRRLGLAALGGTLLCLLTACAGAPPPDETIDQLTAVTEPHEARSDLEQYDFSEHPLPTVAPLECAGYLIITARGTGEPSQGQLLSPVARAITQARPGEVLTLDLDYPADDDINLGGTLGARLLIDTLNQQVVYCPEQKFVLLGYSQGALLVGDALAPPDTRLVGRSVGSLRADARQRIIAIVLYGNPRFIADEAYNAGTYAAGRDGILPRQPGSLAEFDDRLRDYCEAGDFVCQRSLNVEPDVEPHQAYYHNGMQQDGAAFVISKLDPMSPQQQGSLLPQ